MRASTLLNEKDTTSLAKILMELALASSEGASVQEVRKFEDLQDDQSFASAHIVLCSAPVGVSSGTNGISLLNVPSQRRKSRSRFVHEHRSGRMSNEAA